jgi:hypothetical protein
MAELGAIFYRGPSLLTGDPIVGILTGLEGGSLNPKTGPMVQAWILRPELAPMEAKRQNLDDAICGDCALRGKDGFNSTCYVTPWLGPHNTWKMFRRGGYLEATWPELQALLEGRYLRCGAYGDPAAIPVEVWRTLLGTAAGWVAYTHQWRTCDQRLKHVAMASVDTEAEFWTARGYGWRTFRVRGRADALIASGFGAPLEVTCPASDEADHRTTCQRCQLCRGTNRPARSVAIIAHGKPGNIAAFYRGRAEVLA